MIAAFAPIGLDELVDRAALMTRVDRKYVVPVDRLEPVLAGLVPHARALEIAGRRDFGYASTYYDDAALTSFHLAAQRPPTPLQGAVPDVRRLGPVVRRGEDPGRARHDREGAPGADGERSSVEPLPAEAETFVAAALTGFDLRPELLSPVLHTAYRRSTLYLPVSGARITVDTGLTWSLADGRELALHGAAVLETKSGAGASFADRHLWSQGIRPTRISKYGTGLCALDPSVRGNRWHRVAAPPRHDPLRPHLRSDRSMKLPRRASTALVSLTLAAVALTGCSTPSSGSTSTAVTGSSAVAAVGAATRPRSPTPTPRPTTARTTPRAPPP